MGKGPPPKKPSSVPDGDEQTNAVGTDAITALNAAIGGVELLGQVVAHIQDAVTQVGMARFQAVDDLAVYTEAKKDDINAHVETTVKARINQIAATAVGDALQAIKRIQDMLDSFLDKIRRGS